MFNLLINFLIGPVHCSRNTLNGDLASATIPEESRLMAKKKSESEDRSGLCPVVGKLEAGERPYCICCSALLGPWRCPDTTPRLWVFPPGGKGVGPGAKLGPGCQEKGTSRHGFLTQLGGWQGPEPKQSVRPEVQGQLDPRAGPGAGPLTRRWGDIIVKSQGPQASPDCMQGCSAVPEPWTRSSPRPVRVSWV